MEANKFINILIIFALIGFQSWKVYTSLNETNQECGPSRHLTEPTPQSDYGPCIGGEQTLFNHERKNTGLTRKCDTDVHNLTHKLICVYKKLNWDSIMKIFGYIVWFFTVILTVFCENLMMQRITIFVVSSYRPDRVDFEDYRMIIIIVLISNLGKVFLDVLSMQLTLTNSRNNGIQLQPILSGKARNLTNGRWASLDR